MVKNCQNMSRYLKAFNLILVVVEFLLYFAVHQVDFWWVGLLSKCLLPLKSACGFVLVSPDVDWDFLGMSGEGSALDM